MKTKFSGFKQFYLIFACILAISLQNGTLVSAKTIIDPWSDNIISVTDNKLTNIDSATQDLGQEPKIRIGLIKIKDSAIVELNSEYQLMDYNGALLGNLPADSKITLAFDVKKNIYTAKFGKTNISSETSLKISPKNESGDNYFILKNVNDVPKWNKSINYNKFRGSLEIKYSEQNKKIWLINELPLEHYIWGLAESSNNRGLEFQKALTVAARTYAFYHINTGFQNNDTEKSKKHSDRFFHLDATYDQSYKGIEREKYFPTFVEAAKATQGIIAYYGEQIVITPYFSASAGKTKLWSRVWGGKDANYPWIKSVVTKYDKGLKLSGHGVGMSLHDAQKKAEKENLGYQDLLNYYFAGLEFIKKY